jgi:hypothetical protein
MFFWLPFQLQQQLKVKLSQQFILSAFEWQSFVFDKIMTPWKKMLFNFSINHSCHQACAVILAKL